MPSHHTPWTIHDPRTVPPGTINLLGTVPPPLDCTSPSEPQKRAVRILLECFLVATNVHFVMNPVEILLVMNQVVPEWM